MNPFLRSRAFISLNALWLNLSEWTDDKLQEIDNYLKDYCGLNIEDFKEVEDRILEQVSYSRICAPKSIAGRIRTEPRAGFKILRSFVSNVQSSK